MNARVPVRERTGGPVCTCHFWCEMEELHDAYDMKQELEELRQREAAQTTDVPRVPIGDSERILGTR